MKCQRYVPKKLTSISMYLILEAVNDIVKGVGDKILHDWDIILQNTAYVLDQHEYLIK